VVVRATRERRSVNESILIGEKVRQWNITCTNWDKEKENI